MATTPNLIKIIEVTQATASPNSQDSAEEFSLPLTFFDTVCLKLPPVERLFFYKLTENSSTALFNTTILPRLKHSLSLTLSHFLPLAGRLVWAPQDPKPSILYTPNDTVSVVFAESNADFDKLSSKNEIVEAIEFTPYVPSLEMSDDEASIISLQITNFPDLGFSIGISSNHAVLDGKTATMFMKAWAYMCKQGEDKENPPFLPQELTPFTDRKVINDPTGRLDMVYLNNWLQLATKVNPGTNPRSLKGVKFVPFDEDLVMATFVLTREDIKILRERVLSMLNNKVLDEEEENRASRSLHLSSFVLTYAYASVCFVKAKGVESNLKIPFAFIVDCRSRLDPQVPANYLGNCVVVCPVIVLEAGAIMEENGLFTVTKTISDAIRAMEINGVLERAEERMEEWLAAGLGRVMSFTIAGSPKFGVYETDFGWGKPKKVDIVSICRTGAISMAESRDENGGIEVAIVLKKKLEMEIFASLFANGLK